MPVSKRPHPRIWAGIDRIGTRSQVSICATESFRGRARERRVLGAVAAAGNRLRDQSAPPCRMLSSGPIAHPNPTALQHGSSRRTSATVPSEHPRPRAAAVSATSGAPSACAKVVRGSFDVRARAMQYRTPAASVGTSTGLCSAELGSCPRSDRQTTRFGLCQPRVEETPDRQPGMPAEPVARTHRRPVFFRTTVYAAGPRWKIARGIDRSWPSSRRIARRPMPEAAPPFRAVAASRFGAFDMRFPQDATALRRPDP